MSSLSRRGHLIGSTDNAQLLVDLISLYTIKNTSTGNSKNLYSYDVSRAASWLVEGVQLGMASGERPATLVSSNVQLSVVSTLISVSGNLVLTAPATALQVAFGSIQPKNSLGQSGLNSCGFYYG